MTPKLTHYKTIEENPKQIKLSPKVTEFNFKAIRKQTLLASPRHNGINIKTANDIYLVQKYKYC